MSLVCDVTIVQFCQKRVVSNFFYCYAVRLMSPHYGVPHDPIVAVARKTMEFIFLCVCCKAYLFFTVQCPSNA